MRRHRVLLAALWGACALSCTPIAQFAHEKPDADVGSDAGPTRAALDAGVDASSGPAADAGGAPTAHASGKCAVDGAMACAAASGRERLSCQGSIWKAAPPCNDDELCVMSPADKADKTDEQGRCQAVAPECIGHRLGALFCDGDLRRSCDEFGVSKVLACGANERCRLIDDVPRCSCVPGSIDDGSGCHVSGNCSVQQGGCDPLTTCTESAGQRSCGVCPAGYAGDGMTGCKPLLTGVTLSCGELMPALMPALSPSVHDYRIQVALVCQRLTAHFGVPAGTRIELNGAAIAAGSDWTSSALNLGQNTFHLAIASTFGVSNDYNWVVTRAGGQEAYIKASNPATNDGFGASVALSGDTLAVGAPWQNGGAGGVNAAQTTSGADASGAVYVFTRDSKGWAQQAYVKADAPVAGDYFGTDVAILDDVLVVGAPRSDPTGTSGLTPHAGAVYVFVRSAGVWTQQARLSALDGTVGDLFGLRLALSKALLVVGAPASGADASGAVYLFSHDASGWRQSKKLKASKPIGNAAFGSAVALDGDTLAVGSQKDASSVSAGGSAYVFTQHDGDWFEQARLEPSVPRDSATFGWSVAVQGDTLVVGAPRATLSLMAPSGEAYVFDRVAGHWNQSAVLEAPVPRTTDYFGVDVGLTPTLLLIGSSGDAGGMGGLKGDVQNRGAPQSGAMYLYARQPSGFVMSTYIKASVPARGDAFGIRVALSGDTIVAGADYESRLGSGVNPTPNGASLNSGAVYVIR
jgi:hypothetical protein